MAGGWYKDGNVQEQIDASVQDAVKQAREMMKAGASLKECEDCGEPIPERRREAVPGVRRCIECQSELDGSRPRAGWTNRRGNKDSSLK